MPTVVVDTGSGNLRSVEKAAQAAAQMAGGTAASVVVSNDPDLIRRASRLILPGQGAFGDCVKAIQGGIGAAVLEFIASGKPLFGICVGLQLLFEASDEAPGVHGLGVFRGHVRRLQGGPGIKIPHMGWNELKFQVDQPPYLGPAQAAAEYFYFVHSYHAVPGESGVTLATVEYGNNLVTAAVGRDNVFATQFHPEKSQRIGLAVLMEFLQAMMKVIPSIDLLDGKVVRLLKGDYDAVTVYEHGAAEVAAQWRGQVERLHVVDLEGARSGIASQVAQVQRIVEAFGEGVQIGGGVRDLAVIRRYLEMGLARVVLGTAALTDPALLEQAAHMFPGRIILAVDGRKGRVATHGWHEQSEQLAVDVVKSRAHLPLAAVLYTDIDRDGTEIGPNIVETARLATDGGLPVIASGGVGTLTHLTRLVEAAKSSNIVGAIVGRALHEHRFTLEQAVTALQQA